MHHAINTLIESRNATASLSGGLLRLMTAASIYVTPDQPTFIVQFLIAEAVGHLTNQTQEGGLMVTKYFKTVSNYFKQLSGNAAVIWENHRSFRLNLLMSQ